MVIIDGEHGGASELSEQVEDVVCATCPGVAPKEDWGWNTNLESKIMEGGR
eukprot:CAMPEP_0181338980 /NCGR_PEP_ID=MMETSP1101-20121128/28963_1 /TAXON_ID=46948 /ORGANISM="Rhodomonas abbreviata, Strain Caron Lab Isolate" /LENGTH=50 /DNA_ID=CAMNT_0023449821 /DNA_START=99 /DNA_END=247 /DNA_ORIENTATION=+